MSHSMADFIVKNLRLLTQQVIERFGTHKSRRNLFVFILVTTFIVYVLSKWIPRRSNYKDVQYDQCIQSRLEQFSSNAAIMNTIINHEPVMFGETVSLPFTGNGYIGISFSGQSQVQLMSDHSVPFISTGYSPLIRVSSKIWEDSAAHVIHIDQGLVQHIQCFKMNDDRSAYVTHTLYSHRRRPSLIIQEIDIVNPSEQTLDLDFEQKLQTTKHGAKQLDAQDIQFDSSKDKYKMTTYEFSTRNHNTIILVVITLRVDSSGYFKPNSQTKKAIFTIMRYSQPIKTEPFRNETHLQAIQDKLKNQAKEDLSEVLSITLKQLLKEHTDTWLSIWKSGFSISRSFAPSALNGDAINRTIYYILSSTLLSDYDIQLNEHKQSEINSSRFQIEHCFEGHSTFVGDRLWRSPGDDLAIYQLVNIWRSTLSRRGCLPLMSHGIHGMLQAIILSIGGMRYINHHLEVNLDPKELYRDMFFHSIYFGKQYLLNISITVGQENRAVIGVTIDNESAQAYACDAGCLDPPMKLSTTPIRMPVKMTSPSTAILYITEDFDYMTQLKDTIHVKDIGIAPPHSHDILALHRHGHKLGGLPIIFWVALAFLIIIFHLFLLKIVLNEMGFFKHSTSTYTRSRAL